MWDEQAQHDPKRHPESASDKHARAAVITLGAVVLKDEPEPRPGRGSDDPSQNDRRKQYLPIVLLLFWVPTSEGFEHGSRRRYVELVDLFDVEPIRPTAG